MPSEPSFALPEGSTYSPVDDVLDAIPGEDRAYEDTPEGDMVGRDEQGRVSGLIVQGAARRVRRDGGLYSTLPGLGRVRIVGAEESSRAKHALRAGARSTGTSRSSRPPR